MTFYQIFCLLFLSYATSYFTFALSAEISPFIQHIHKVTALRLLNVKLPSSPQHGGEIYLILRNNNQLMAKTKRDLTSEDTICAFGQYQDTLSQTGWDQLNIYTEDNCGRLGTMYAAGWVEGYLSYKKILQYYHNYISADTDLMSRLSDAKQVFSNAYESALQRAQTYKKSRNDRERTFWNGIELFASQFEGLTAGFRSQTQDLDREDLMFVNSNGEIGDITDALDTFLKDAQSNFVHQQSSGKSTRLFRSPKKGEPLLLTGLTLEEAHNLRVQKLFESHCSAFIKLVKDRRGKVKDVMVAHATWDDYEGMLKVMKKYHLKVTPFDGDSAVDYKIVFSSYPGSLTSQDDYYVREKGLILMETSLNVYNNSLYDNYLDPKTYLPTFLKLAASNFFGDTARKWVDNFGFLNTGTYNSQWMVLDVQAIKESIGDYKLKAESFFVLEQLPGLLMAKDMTSTLNHETYWSSFNLPYFDETYELSGAKAIYDATGSPDFSRTEDARSVAFREMQDKIQNLEDLKSLIRHNNIGKNGYSANGDSSQSGQIAPRYDLSPNLSEKQLTGATDGKVTNIKLAKEIGLVAVSGPTQIDSEPFSFSNEDYQTLQGMPRTWDFDWEKYSF